mgnify:FL=1
MQAADLGKGVATESEKGKGIMKLYANKPRNYEKRYINILPATSQKKEHTMNEKQRMYQRIEKHGNDLKRIFNLDIDAIQISKKVHMIEVKTLRIATDYCNGENGIDSKTWEPETEKILKALDKVLNFKKQDIPVFVNGDVRGYALKIDDDYVRKYNLEIHKDWGGYGCLAPEFDGKE